MNEETLIEFSITPIGGDDSTSISPVVTRAVERVKTSGLSHEVHAMGTIVEGQLEDCLALVRECVRDALRESPRVAASVRLDVRPGHTGRIEQNVKSVKQQERRRSA